MSIVSGGFPCGHLKIWAPGEDDGGPAAFGPGLSPEITLREFFERWFLPIVLIGEREDSAGTVTIYRDALGWWGRLTDDPPLARIDEYAVAEFKARLKAATYRRGRAGAERPLSASTRHKHLRQIRALLHRAGPTVDPKRPAKGLVPVAPHVPLPPVETKPPKPPFSLDAARRMYAAADDMTWGEARGGVIVPDYPCPLFWRAWESVHYYTGQRAGTVLALRWEHLRREGGRAWLDIPGALVSKTRKGLTKFLRGEALRDLERLREARGGEEIGPLLPWPYSYSHLADKHEALQELAGLASRLGPHAWRRTHGVEMGRVGAEAALRAAKQALDHGDEQTTRRYYVDWEVDLEPEFIRRLPALAPEKSADDTRQKRLF